jgi:hypothetical protein
VWKAYLVFSDGSEEDVSTRVVWTSSAPLIAEVSVLETEKGRIYGRRLGNATLQANFFGLLQSVPVSVGGARAKTLEVQSLSSGTLGLYLSRDFKAFADFTDGIRREVTNSVSWSIESLGGNAYFDPASKGRLVSTASGDVRVLARLQGQEVIQTLTVGTVVPVFVQILGADTIVSLTASSPRALTTRVTMSDGAMVDRTSATEWTYTTTGEGLNFAAYVENGEGRKGLCTPLRAGKIRVTASFSGLETSAVVEVQ